MAFPVTKHLPTAFNQRLYRTAQVREFDRIAIEEHGIPGAALMKRAAAALLKVALQRWPEVQRPLVFCGGGNNGGDGYLFAALAKQQNLEPLVISAAEPKKLRGDARRAWKFAGQAGVKCLSAEEFASSDARFEGADLIVDALLGTGLESAVRPAYQQLIEAINNSGLPVLAADLPSGIHSDSGEVLGCAVQAACTVSFVALKTGLASGAGKTHSGELLLSRLGIPETVYGEEGLLAARILSLPHCRAYLPQRDTNSHKGHHGHVLIIGGDAGYGGAAMLAAEASLFAGAGLVSLATRAAHIPAVLAKTPEVMAHAVESAADLRPLLATCTAVVVGPGLGRSSWAMQLLHAVLETAALPAEQRSVQSVVFDADALNLLAETKELMHLLSSCELDTIFTPHPGEAARLLEITTAEVQQNRFESVTRLENLLAGAVLLKGAGSLLSGSNNITGVCPFGNPGMSSGGMGDVLSGLIGALCAQGLSATTALELATCVHSAAADFAVAEGKGPIGLHASELLPYARSLLNATASDLPELIEAFDRPVRELVE